MRKRRASQDDNKFFGFVRSNNVYREKCQPYPRGAVHRAGGNQRLPQGNRRVGEEVTYPTSEEFPLKYSERCEDK
jgi:hypothetical protein